MSYAFPPDHFDFSRNAPERLADTRAVEVAIGRELRSGDPERVKNGLSNILYWGYGQMGIRDTRVRRFRIKVTSSQLNQSCALFRRSRLPSVVEIKSLSLPEFARLSFVSKIRMFLDPSFRNPRPADYEDPQTVPDNSPCAALHWQQHKHSNHCK